MAGSLITSLYGAIYDWPSGLLKSFNDHTELGGRGRICIDFVFGSWLVLNAKSGTAGGMDLSKHVQKSSGWEDV